MRSDMFKVLVERPRPGAGWDRPGRAARSLEDLPPRLKMPAAGRRTKWLNENLRPLQRYLAKQVGRPWDKVYSEICANIDGRSTVQQHILLHVEDFVAVQARIVDEAVEVWDGWRGWVTLGQAHYELYVDPRSGLLRSNRARLEVRRARASREAREQAAVDERRRDIGPMEQLHCVDGLWYHVTLAVLPEPQLRVSTTQEGTSRALVYPARWDTLRRRSVSRRHDREGPGGTPGSLKLYGREGVYALRKRQLGRRELRQYGLRA